MHGDASKTDWEKAMEILAKCVELAGYVVPIVGAVSAVYGLAIQVKNG